MNAILLVALLSLLHPTTMQTFNQDAEGFIRNWLVLAPIPLEGDATGIDHDFLKGEATSSRRPTTPSASAGNRSPGPTTRRPTSSSTSASPSIRMAARTSPATRWPTFWPTTRWG